MTTEIDPAVGDALRMQPSVGDQAEAEQMYSVLNPEYPASYWQVAFSADVAVAEVVPLRVLERDIVVWRDSGRELHCASAHCGHLGAHMGYGGEVIDDTLRCPFHAWQYDAAGKVVAIPGIEGRLKTRACLQVYRVVERYGTIFLWNGPSVPDHDLPDALAEAGLREDDVYFEHIRFKLPFAGKPLMENGPDAAHFSALHGFGSWGDSEILVHDATKLEFIAHFYDRLSYPKWADVKRAYRRGELPGLLVDAMTSGDVRSIPYGSGIHLYTIAPSQQPIDRSDASVKLLPRLWVAVAKAAAEAAGEGAYILSHTPCDKDSHILYGTFFMPRVKNPVLRALSKPIAKEMMARLLFFAVWQDAMVMIHRQEPDKPAYHRFDRRLLELRQFWKDRTAIAARGAETSPATPSDHKGAR
ncbi:Rieske (2Fe-2S) protein [Mycobacterium sp. GA-2829]|uniref:Rieske (2Fe-2S) protein n=1 Tax=Mycobacterium sp. GA-2829 TaxID=1772283 RepID=UPI0007401D4A|nr:Rieske (2Fe-2S) protein [Mycobacterium sp. GA-2829]KUI29275.1 hypothetical protein AU194_20595 [Mycobacterium sp. GA-2829]